MTAISRAQPRIEAKIDAKLFGGSEESIEVKARLEVDSELRFRFAAVYATTLSRHNHREPSGREYDHVILGKHPSAPTEQQKLSLGDTLWHLLACVYLR